MAAHPGRRGDVGPAWRRGRPVDGCEGHPTLTPKSFAMPDKPEAYP
jgi:hypothetical protein